jgi:hypothetical protein
MSKFIFVMIMVGSFFASCDTKKNIDERYEEEVDKCYLILALIASQSSSSSNNTSSTNASGTTNIPYGNTCLKDAAKKRAQERSRTPF